MYRIPIEIAVSFNEELLEEWKKSKEVFTPRFLEMYEELLKVQFDGFNKDTKYNLDHKDYLEHALTHQRKHHNKFDPERGKQILVYYTIVTNSHALQPYWKLMKRDGLTKSTDIGDGFSITKFNIKSD